ncbi:M56 family metallopeptidase [Gimesia sp.]|uniref:M56 family metallopeptidase n=1 Tax=Gimesia sp. TaxID=2024833 RepID=UPI003A8F23A3
MFQTSNQWMLFLLAVSVKALLLAGIAGLSLKLLKMQDSNVKHRVWSGVLAGMLLLPLLILILPTTPLAMPARWTQFESTAEHTPVETTFVDSQNLTPPAPAFENSVSEKRDTPVSPTESVPQPAILPPSTADATVTVSNWSFPSLLPLIPGVFLVFWFAVSLLFAFRLFAGLWSSSRILRHATLVDDSRLQNFLAELPPAILRRTPKIRESREMLVPVTVGWLRPTVLLPEEWRTWPDAKLRAIVTHEFTHVARRDFFVLLAAELNRCLYWFHPVSWWLRTRLSDLAEEICDDAAISHTGDRTGYARHLLEVATSLSSASGRRVQPGVSMARTSNVESRITTILDFKRPLSQHLTWRSTTAIASITIAVITAAAVIRPISAVATPAEPSVATESVPDSEDTETVRIQGQVTDTSGKPIPDATVRLYHLQAPDWYAAGNTETLITEFKVDAAGRYDQRVPRDQVILKPGHLRSWPILLVTAPDYAYSTFQAKTVNHFFAGKQAAFPGFLNQPLAVQLRPAVTIHGRLLSIEGQPVEGVSVSVFKMGRPDPAGFDEWLQQTSKVPPPKLNQRAMVLGRAASRSAYFPSHEFHLPLQSVRPVVTDSSGRFELSGLAAKDDLVILRIRGQNITDKIIHVLAREMQPVYGLQYSRISHLGAYYGRKFDFITQPSVPVFGVVRDIETRQPLAGIPVAVGQIYGATMSQEGYITTQTDKQGRYRIEGLPIPPAKTGRYDRNRLAVRPGKLPYIETESLSVPRGDGVNPVEFNFEMRRAVIARGRITDKTTGEPVAGAEFYYAPYLENENCSKYLRYADGSRRMLGNHDTRYFSNKDGYFEIPVIPGRGVIAATLKGGEFITGFGAEKIEAYQGKDSSNLPIMLSDHLVSSMFHSLKEIDVPADSSEFELSLHVDPGETMTVNFIDPQGNPVKGVQGNGFSSNSLEGDSTKDDHAQVTGLAIGKIRPMYFVDNTNKLSRFLRLVPEKGQKQFTVKLFPSSRLTGRLIDPEGRPLANSYLETRHQNDPNIGGSLSQVQTDSEGRFDYSLPTGTDFKILSIINNNYFVVMKNLENPDPKHIDLGDMVIDPDAEDWSQAKAKREPVITELISGTDGDQNTDSDKKE